MLAKLAQCGLSAKPLHDPKLHLNAQALDVQCLPRCSEPMRQSFAMSTQMDRGFEGEQLGTLFVQWGALSVEGCGGGMGGPFGPPAKKLHVMSTTFFPLLVAFG